MMTAERPVATEVKPLRIALFVNGFPAVSETFILNQITGLLDLGHNVDIYAMSRAEGVRHAEVEKYKLLERTYFVRIPATKWEGLRTLVRLAFHTIVRHPLALCRAMSTGRPTDIIIRLDVLKYLESKRKNGVSYDIIHCHYGQIGRRFVSLKKRFGTKYLVSFHGYDLFTYGDRGTKAYRQLFDVADCVIANTDYSAENIAAFGCPREKIRKLPSSLKMDKFKFRARTLEPGSVIRLLTVARLDEVKGIKYSIEAVVRLAHKYPIEYRIVGEGPERPHLEDLIRRHGLSDKVFLLGARAHEEVIELLNGAHIFILASITSKLGLQDNGPNVLKEAQACGLPLVATNTGAIPEVLQDGLSGFLVPESDVDALAEKLEYLINHPEIWPEMGRAGRRYIEERFDIARVSQQNMEIYRSLFKAR